MNKDIYLINTETTCLYVKPERYPLIYAFHEGLPHVEPNKCKKARQQMRK